MITILKGSYLISKLCDALGVSRSGYHAACARLIASHLAANEALLVHMQAIHSHRHKRLPLNAHHFDMVELNSSFYALPSPRMCAEWV